LTVPETWEDGGHRTHRSGSGHRSAQIPPGNLFRPELDAVSLALKEIKPARSKNSDQNKRNNDLFYHISPAAFSRDACATL
jgi:hypothetical protein